MVSYLLQMKDLQMMRNLKNRLNMHLIFIKTLIRRVILLAQEYLMKSLTKIQLITQKIFQHFLLYLNLNLKEQQIQIFKIDFLPKQITFIQLMKTLKQNLDIEVDSQRGKLIMTSLSYKVPHIYQTADYQMYLTTQKILILYTVSLVKSLINFLLYQD